MSIDHKIAFRSPSMGDPWSVPTPRFVLDTNVVSAFQSVATRGFVPSIPEHQRVAHFLDRTRTLGKNFGADTLLDSIEGSSFHRGGPIDPYNTLCREAAVRGLFELEPERLEGFLASGDSLEVPTTVNQTRTIAERVEFFGRERTWLFYPSYAVALVVRVWDGSAHQVSMLTRLQQLRDDIGLIPDAPLLAALLLELGTAEVRTDLAQGLFKARHPDVRTACLSAGWDLSYLNYTALVDSTARQHDLPLEEQPRHTPDGLPVLVTGDKPLSKIANMIRMLHTGSTSAERRMRLNVPFDFLPDRNRTPLNVARGTLNPPDNLDPEEDRSEALFSAINSLEAELGLTLTDHESFDSIVDLEADWVFIDIPASSRARRPGRRAHPRQ